MFQGKRDLMFGGAAVLRESKATTTFSANNTTVSVPMFTVTGSVLIKALWGEVTTVIGSNHTTAYIRLNDQTAQVDLSVNTGITLSSLAVGTLILRKGLSGAALSLKSNAAGAVDEAGSAGLLAFSEFTATKKTGALTQIEYRYTTTNTPTSGAVLWHALWLPLSNDGNLA